MNITNGGRVSNTVGLIGYDSGSTGVVTVDGSGSMWTCNGSLTVGGTGSGAMKITNGGAVKSGVGRINCGPYCLNNVTVDGSGSTWTMSEDCYIGVGYRGDSFGTLEITNGGCVSTPHANYNDSYSHIGYRNGVNPQGQWERWPIMPSTATVDGTGSTWTTGTIRLGEDGSGLLNITNVALSIVV